MHAAALGACFASVLGEQLLEAGCSALLLELQPRAEPSDRELTAELEGALAALAARPEANAQALALIGLGAAGTAAFLCACTSRRVAVVVDVCGSLMYPGLDAQRPVQPLDMALNLTAPVLIVYAEQDPEPAPQEARQAAARLERALRSVELVSQPGRADDFLCVGSPGYHVEHAARTSAVIATYLGATFAEL